MAREPIIKRVVDNDDKQFTYAITIGRLEEAMRSGFYLEALLIDGAFIEDRIRSYLFHLGVFELRESREANADICTKLVEMPGTKGDKKLGTLKVDTLEAEIALINATVKWFKRTKMQPDDPYLCAMWVQYRDYVDTDYLRNVMKSVDRWRKLRNEVIHGLLHKHVEALDGQLPDYCDEGLAIFRELDHRVEQVSRGGSIRRALNLAGW